MLVSINLTFPVMPRPLQAIIHLDAMRHNLARARACAGGARVWAVVKANAYGHGLERGMRGFAAADGLALIEPEYAVRLRELGWDKPVLLLEGIFSAEDVPLLAAYRIDSAVHCWQQVELLEAAPPEGPVDVHLKMNTGMNRLGFAPAEFGAAYARLKAVRNVRDIILMTHFANADEIAHPMVSIGSQVERFVFGAAGIGAPRSFCNSGGVLAMPGLGEALASDWVRPGIMLYGGSPGGRTAEEFGLLPAMTLEAGIIGVQDIEAGESVGYGSRFVAARPTRVGVVACGYADGYPRHADTGTPVLVDGQRTRLIGRVSMDMLTIDLTDLPQAGMHSTVTLWGRGLPVDEVAHAAETIGYELMCAVAPRVRIVEQELPVHG
jgi:alanine racemase